MKKQVEEQKNISENNVKDAVVFSRSTKFLCSPKKLIKGSKRKGFKRLEFLESFLEKMMTKDHYKITEVELALLCHINSELYETLYSYACYEFETKNGIALKTLRNLEKYLERFNEVFT